MVRKAIHKQAMKATTLEPKREPRLKGPRLKLLGQTRVRAMGMP